MSHQNEFKKVLISPPHATLGKKGITGEFILHIQYLLKKYKIIKIKMLKSIATKANIRSIAEQISNSTNSYLLDIRGKTIIISLNDIRKGN
ncbi:MAG TPA: YhbY family RNA-binding protein [Candidatus Nanopelagicaceae bacterium]|nr:YhbY family RNA-binding protein [Candidatus Nanopelagicaceae bacterium]